MKAPKLALFGMVNNSLMSHSLTQTDTDNNNNDENSAGQHDDGSKKCKPMRTYVATSFQVVKSQKVFLYLQAKSSMHSLLLQFNLTLHDEVIIFNI